MVRERFADLTRVEVTLLFGDRGIGSRGLFADQVRLLDPWFLSLYVVHMDECLIGRQITGVLAAVDSETEP